MNPFAMNSSPSIRLLHIVSLSLLVATGLLAVGCDSGGDNDDSGASLDGDLTFRAESSSSISINYAVMYFYDGGTCQSSGANEFGEDVPVEAALDGPSSTNCDGEPSDFDGVQITATMNNANPDFLSMTLQLRSDGDVIDEATDSENFGGTETWIVEAGEVPDQSQ